MGWEESYFCKFFQIIAFEIGEFRFFIQYESLQRKCLNLYFTFKSSSYILSCGKGPIGNSMEKTKEKIMRERDVFRQRVFQAY
jgi:hypothetical protein